MKMKKKSIKDKKGITLVALVITVVVMLILAGVAIAAVVDGDGLFSRTRQAVETYENAARDEGDTIQSMINQIDEYLGEKNPPLEEGPIENPINQIVNVNQTFSGETTGSYDDPIIPKGFKPVGNAQDSTITEGAEWGSENGYQYGLVIQDESENQFVWVPVDGTNVVFERYNFGNINSPISSYDDLTETLPIELTESVNNNGGFYIGRYEAGISEDMPQENLSSDSTALYGDGTYKPVFKQGSIVWNYIQWGANNDETDPGNGVVTIARNMYPENDNNYGAVSTLIYGAQWDTALDFIGAYDVGEAGYDIYATNSEGMGNYHGVSGADIFPSIAPCGAADAFRQKNIYDMAGNVYEWTMEMNDTKRVIRGDDYIYGTGEKYPASCRTSTRVDTSKDNRRFPCSTLYKVGMSSKEKRSNCVAVAEINENIGKGYMPENGIYFLYVTLNYVNE